MARGEDGWLLAENRMITICSLRSGAFWDWEGKGRGGEKGGDWVGEEEGSACSPQKRRYTG